MICQVCGKSFETRTALAKHLEVMGRSNRPHREYLKRLGFDSGDPLFGVDFKRLIEALGKLDLSPSEQFHDLNRQEALTKGRFPLHSFYYLA